MPVSVGFQAFRPASSFVTWDTEALRNPARFIPATVGHNTTLLRGIMISSVNGRKNSEM